MRAVVGAAVLSSYAKRLLGVCVVCVHVYVTYDIDRATVDATRVRRKMLSEFIRCTHTTHSTADDYSHGLTHKKNTRSFINVCTRMCLVCVCVCLCTMRVVDL